MARPRAHRHDGKFEGQGARIDCLTHVGCTPLLVAATVGHEACVRLLLERGADVALRAQIGTALERAKTDAIKALLRAHGATE